MIWFKHLRNGIKIRIVKYAKNKAKAKSFNNGENILLKTNSKMHMMRYRKEINRKKFVTLKSLKTSQLMSNMILEIEKNTSNNNNNNNKQRRMNHKLNQILNQTVIIYQIII